ncbi:MAG: glycerate-2-kinase family protein, partial [Pseudomonadota bacterium]
MTNMMDAKDLMKKAFSAGVARVQPTRCLPPDLTGAGAPTGVIAMGKAAVAMIEAALPRLGAPPLFAFAVAPYGHALHHAAPSVEIIEASHPHPDENSLRAGARALTLAATLGPGQRLLALVSGGGSSTLCAPAPGVRFEEKRAAIAALHRAGAPIGDINAVRSALSSVKSGRLGAAAKGAFVQSFIISDVPGDDPASVASGPTVRARKTDDATQII